MAGEEIQQDTRTVDQIVDGMSLFDDDLMSMVFDGNIEATELLLRIILKKGRYSSYKRCRSERIAESCSRRAGHPSGYSGKGQYGKAL